MLLLACITVNRRTILANRKAPFVAGEERYHPRVRFAPMYKGFTSSVTYTLKKALVTPRHRRRRSRDAVTHRRSSSAAKLEPMYPNPSGSPPQVPSASKSAAPNNRGTNADSSSGFASGSAGQPRISALNSGAAAPKATGHPTLTVEQAQARLQAQHQANLEIQAAASAQARAQLRAHAQTEVQSAQGLIHAQPVYGHLRAQVQAQSRARNQALALQHSVAVSHNATQIARRQVQSQATVSSSLASSIPAIQTRQVQGVPSNRMYASSHIAGPPMMSAAQSPTPAHYAVQTSVQPQAAYRSNTAPAPTVNVTGDIRSPPVRYMQAPTQSFSAHHPAPQHVSAQLIAAQHAPARHAPVQHAPGQHTVVHGAAAQRAPGHQTNMLGGLHRSHMRAPPTGVQAVLATGDRLRGAPVISAPVQSIHMRGRPVQAAPVRLAPAPHAAAHQVSGYPGPGYYGRQHHPGQRPAHRPASAASPGHPISRAAPLNRIIPKVMQPSAQTTIPTTGLQPSGNMVPTSIATTAQPFVNPAAAAQLRGPAVALDVRPLQQLEDQGAPPPRVPTHNVQLTHLHLARVAAGAQPDRQRPSVIAGMPSGRIPASSSVQPPAVQKNVVSPSVQQTVGFQQPQAAVVNSNGQKQALPTAKQATKITPAVPGQEANTASNVPSNAASPPVGSNDAHPEPTIAKPGSRSALSSYVADDPAAFPGLIEEVACAMQKLWHHPPGQSQVDSLVLHRLRAVLAIDTDLTRAKIAQISKVSADGLGRYMRGIYNGRQQSFEEKLGIFLRNYYDASNVHKRNEDRQRAFASLAKWSSAFAPSNGSSSSAIAPPARPFFATGTQRNPSSTDSISGMQSVPKAELELERAARQQLLCARAGHLKRQWLHPKTSSQRETPLLHRARALFDIDTGMSTHAIAKAAHVPNWAVISYLSGHFMGDQTNIEAGLARFIDEFERGYHGTSVRIPANGYIRKRPPSSPVKLIPRPAPNSEHMAPRRRKYAMMEYDSRKYSGTIANTIAPTSLPPAITKAPSVASGASASGTQLVPSSGQGVMRLRRAAAAKSGAYTVVPRRLLPRREVMPIEVVQSTPQEKKPLKHETALQNKPESKTSQPESKPVQPETSPPVSKQAPSDSKPAPPDSKQTPPDSNPAAPNSKQAPPDSKQAPPDNKPAPPNNKTKQPESALVTPAKAASVPSSSGDETASRVTRSASKRLQSSDGPVRRSSRRRTAEPSPPNKRSRK